MLKHNWKVKFEGRKFVDPNRHSCGKGRFYDMTLQEVYEKLLREHDDCDPLKVKIIAIA